MRTCDTLITNDTGDWKGVRDACRVTVNRGPLESDPSPDFKKMILISEHSPIRLIRIRWVWTSIKSWIATHFSRHWLGWDKYIGTRRSDRIGKDRNELPQGELIPMSVEANAQALINVSKVRLCFNASPETREYMEDLKIRLRDFEPELSNVMVPSCVYRCGCPEPQTCGFWSGFVKKYPNILDMSIYERYIKYRQEFDTRIGQVSQKDQEIQRDSQEPQEVDSADGVDSGSQAVLPLQGILERFTRVL